jgi:hypothetical protein
VESRWSQPDLTSLIALAISAMRFACRDGCRSPISTDAGSFRRFFRDFRADIASARLVNTLAMTSRTARRHWYMTFQLHDPLKPRGTPNDVLPNSVNSVGVTLRKRPHVIVCRMGSDISNDSELTVNHFVNQPEQTLRQFIGSQREFPVALGV